MLLFYFCTVLPDFLSIIFKLLHAFCKALVFLNAPEKHFGLHFISYENKVQSGSSAKPDYHCNV